jgi:hypothetical protein
MTGEVKTGQGIRGDLTRVAIEEPANLATPEYG